MTTAEIVIPTVVPGLATAPKGTERIQTLAGAFLVGFHNPATRRGYETDIRMWLEFCESIELDPFNARRSHFELYMRDREVEGNTPATINRKMTALTSFYQWLVDEDYLHKNAAKIARRPRVPDETSRDWLTGVELARWIRQAEIEGGYTYALACLLGYNALRISEITQANVQDMGRDRHNHTLHIMGKGTKPATVVLNGPTKWAIDEALGDRTYGPLILSGRQARLTRDAAGRTCRRLAKAAGIKGKNITPHSLRHSAITAMHDAGADPRAVQEFARHVKYITTQRYDHKRVALDDHGSYRLAGYIADRTEW